MNPCHPRVVQKSGDPARFRRPGRRWLVLLGCVAALWWGGRVPAQFVDFSLAASASPDSVSPGEAVFYSLFITNISGVTLPQIIVTNQPSGPAELVGATNSFGGFITNSDTGLIFTFGPMAYGQVARLTMSLRPQTSGSFTNEFTVFTLGRTNMTTNLVTQVGFPVADLAIGLTNASTGIFTNDLTTIGLFVTNLGPSAATGVVLTNWLPSAFQLVSVTPPDAATDFSDGALTWPIGTLAAGANTRLLVAVRSPQAGNFQLTAAVGGGGDDPNPTNNVATSTLPISAFISGGLAATVLAQQINPQTGLLEMRVLLTNQLAAPVPAVRLAAAGLPAGVWLYNAAGTNAGSAYVLYNFALTGQSGVELTLEFYTLEREPLSDYTLTPLGVTPIDLSTASTNGMAVTKQLMTPNGFLIEFAANIGRTYTIIYQDGPGTNTWLTVQPSVVAPATRVQWIDRGPPKTRSAPLSVGQRVYRVLEMP